MKQPKKWLRFLDSLFGEDAAQIRLLQEMFGYLAVDGPSYHKMFVIQGPARSGKGIIVRTLRGVVGAENVVAPTIGSLTSRFGLEPLLGKRVAIIVDPFMHSRVQEQRTRELFLSIVGGDKIDVNRKFKSIITAVLPTRIVVAANEIPDKSFPSNKTIMIRLSKSFLGVENMDLPKQMEREIPAIREWALVGRKRLLRRGRFAYGGRIGGTMSRTLADTMEWFRKRAKRLHKAIKKDDETALARYFKTLPYEQKESICLMKVQHAVAVEAGFKCWADLLNSDDAKRMAFIDSVKPPA